MSVPAWLNVLLARFPDTKEQVPMKALWEAIQQRKPMLNFAITLNEAEYRRVLNGLFEERHALRFVSASLLAKNATEVQRLLVEAANPITQVMNFAAARTTRLVIPGPTPIGLKATVADPLIAVWPVMNTLLCDAGIGLPQPMQTVVEDMVCAVLLEALQHAAGHPSFFGDASYAALWAVMCWTPLGIIPDTQQLLVLTQ